MGRIVLILICMIFTMGAGYNGKLPNITPEFSYKSETPTKSYPPHTPNDNDNAELKPVPKENKTYIEVIVKKNKTLEYTQDIITISKILEKLKICIEQDQDIQKFNAISSNLIDHIALLQTTYQGKQESNYLSYKSLVSLSPKARDIAILKTESQIYNKYLPYSTAGAPYKKDNVLSKEKALLSSVIETLYVIKNLD